MILIGSIIVLIGLQEQTRGSIDMRHASDAGEDFKSVLDEGYERARVGGIIIVFGMGLTGGGVNRAYILYN